MFLNSQALLVRLANWRDRLFGTPVRQEKGHLRQIFLAALVGVLAGYLALIFRLAVDYVSLLVFGVEQESSYLDFIALLPWWQILLVPVAGGVLIGTVRKFLLGGNRAAGIPDVIYASHMQGGRMEAMSGVKSSLIHVLSLGFGSSTGREGPVVHLCGAVASALGTKFRVNRKMRLTLLGCAVASGVAASFNAPIAGVFFALEVVVGHYSLYAFAPIVVASVVGTLVTRIHLGDYPAFIIPDYNIVSFLEFPAFLLLGVTAAVAACLFIIAVGLAENIFNKLKLKLFSRLITGGFLVGLIALVFPQVLGIGYHATDLALKAELSLGLMLALVLAKSVATAISIGSGFGGGVFSPSLFLGAMIGGAFGAIAAQVAPDLASSYGLYAIVGMGAVAGAVLGAPISTILMVFELTGDYSTTIAVMLATAVASQLTLSIVGRSFFTWQLERRGLSIRGGRVREMLGTTKVRHVMTFDLPTLPSEADLDTVRNTLRKAPEGEVFVLDEDRNLVGSITYADLKSAAFERDYDNLLQARNVCHESPAVIYTEDSLEKALKQLDRSGEDHLPVLQSQNDLRFIGVVKYKALLVAYNKALLEARAEERPDL